MRRSVGKAAEFGAEGGDGNDEENRKGMGKERDTGWEFTCHIRC